MKNFRTALFVALFALLLSGCMEMGNVNRIISSAERHVTSISQATAEFTPEEEYYLGRAVAAQIIQKYPVLQDNTANSYVNRLGQALSMYSAQPFTYAGYRFALLDSSEVNAFAAPGGIIFITRGMVGLVSGESELAAVLAHEIVHVQNRDAVRSIKASRMTSAFMGLGKDAAGQYASGVPGVQLLGAFSGSVEDIVGTLVTSGYSRSQEYAADSGAAEILALAGYNPHALNRVLQAMAQKVPPGSAGFGSTHPSAADRLAAVKSAGAGQKQESAECTRRFREALGKYGAAR